jgi:hypothetical protein
VSEAARTARREFGADFRDTPVTVDQDRQLSVEQLLGALQRKGIPLPFEIGTFLVLQATEQALVLEATEQGLAAPPVLSVADVCLNDDGEVAVLATRSADTEKEACAALVVMLGDLLVRSAPGVPPMLLALVEQGPSEGQWTLMRLRDDLEASLVPLNRGALRRVLARLLREVRREVERAPASTPDVRAVDRDLDALFGIESAAEAVEPSVPPNQVPVDADEEARTVRWTAEDARRELGGVLPHERAPRERIRAPARRAERPDDDEGRVRARGGDALDAFERESVGRGGSVARVGAGFVLLAAVLVAGYLLLGRERVQGIFGLSEAGSAGGASAGAKVPEPTPPSRRYGELRVTSSPARAQVLAFVGAGPALATDLPVGVAHEFVAMADDKAPSRAVVPAGVPWPADSGRARYELALQLDDARGKTSGDELGPTRLPDDVGKSNGTLGDVRIVTSPPGAKVYQVVGFTPDVRIENVALDGEPLELVIYLRDHALARTVVRDADFKQRDGSLVAEIDVTLTRKR